MATKAATAWNVAAYEAFHDLRLRPALDLLARVPSLPPGDIVDLGCGAGAAAPALQARFSDRRIIGADSSSEMLAKAEEGGVYASLMQADITDWRAAAPPALTFTNAALHWLPSHESLIPQLFDQLTPGGILAIQMPSQLTRPSHQTMIDAAASVRPDLFTGWKPFPGHLRPEAYAGLLAEASVDIWSTEYLQRLSPDADGGHPVRVFSSSTAGRPVLSRLDRDETHAFTTAWDKALTQAYPSDSEGAVWFPFRRLFIIARKPA